jgi:hypothetical protein
VTGQWLPGVHPAPNIQEHPDLYEVENRAADPEGRIEQAMWELAPWAGQVVLDVGAGAGFHLERFSRRAGHVLAVAELARVLRPGGTAFVVDNDWRSGTFASWLARSEWCSWADPDRIEAFWRDQGFASVRVESEWQFQRREDLEAVLGVEFPPALAEELRREHPGTSVDVHYLVHHRRF